MSENKCWFCGDENYTDDKECVNYGIFENTLALREKVDFGVLGEQEVDVDIQSDGQVYVYLGIDANIQICFDKKFKFCPFCGKKLPQYKDEEELLLYDGYSGKLFYANADKMHEYMRDPNNHLSGEYHADITDDKEPCLYLEPKEDDNE